MFRRLSENIGPELNLRAMHHLCKVPAKAPECIMSGTGTRPEVYKISMSTIYTLCCLVLYPVSYWLCQSLGNLA